jgi:hypothetical protein
VEPTGTTRSRSSSPVNTSVGTATRRQSAAKSTFAASRIRAAINDGMIGAVRHRIPCLAKNPTRFRTAGSAALTSGHTRKGEVNTKAGSDHHGRAIQPAC